MNSSATLAAELREAVTTGGLSVAYQPLFDLREHGVPTTPVGVEALARWTHPQLGAVVPDAFIPLAEQTGLIGDIGTQVLQQAGAQVGAWQRAGYPIGLSLNASPSEFSPGFVDTLAERVDQLGLAPHSLTLEITEAPAPQLLPTVVEVLPRLRDAGIAVSIDDYGAGDVDLNILEELQIAEVKIDRSLTQRSDAEADAEIDAVVRRAARHGWRVVAEGIETEADLERARDRGCDIGQGYLLGRPVSPTDVTRLLARSSRG